MPSAAAAMPRKMLPAPRTIATSTSSSCSRLIWSAMRPSVSGSVPNSSGPVRASPESFSRIRLKAGNLSGADREPGEAPDDHVLAGLGRQLGAELFDRLALVLLRVDVLLAQQDDLVEPLADLALGGLLALGLGHAAGQLRRGDAGLLGALLGGNLLLGDVLRPGRGDVQRDVAGEGDEVVVLGHEVGVA